MSGKIRSIGIIRLEPVALDRVSGTCDDSTLETLLASLSQRSCLSDITLRRRAQLSATRRLNWPVPSIVHSSVQVQLAQLIDELQAEFDRAESAGL